MTGLKLARLRSVQAALIRGSVGEHFMRRLARTAPFARTPLIRCTRSASW